MPTEPVISVRGEAVLEVDPEIALVWVTVTARDRDRRRAVELLAERTRRATAVVNGHGAAIEKLDSGQVNVRPEFKDGKPRERIAGYVAQGSLTVTVADFAVLGDLVTGLADLELVTVNGPNWQLRPASPARRDARLAAVRDALRRAREYAEAFGATITGLTEAADTGLLAPPPAHPVAFAARARVAPQAYEPPEFDFEPAKQTVSAQIEARFTMTPPSFGG
jgi:uncharacterized protein